MPLDHWLPGFNFNVEEWDAEGKTYETLAICRTLSTARPAGRFMIRNMTRAPRAKLSDTFISCERCPSAARQLAKIDRTGNAGKSGCRPNCCVRQDSPACKFAKSRRELDQAQGLRPKLAQIEPSRPAPVYQ
jgi:hypothetical protein